MGMTPLFPKIPWEMKEKYNEMPSLKLSIVRFIPGYSNISKRRLLCVHEKYEIINYPNQEELLSKRLELISKCRRSSKYLMSIKKSND